jgi:cytochrome P450
LEVRPTNIRKEILAPPVRGQSEKRAPGPRGRRLLGSLLEVRRDRLSFVTQATREYGDLICFRMGPKRLYLLNHPNYAKHVLSDNIANYRKGLGLAESEPLLGQGLLTSEGDLWASQRRLLQTAFHGKHMEDFSRSMVEATHARLGRWEKLRGGGQSLDIAQEMVGLTINILGSALFRLDFDDIAEDLSVDLTLLTRWAMARMTSLWGLPLNVPTPRNVRAQKALRRLESAVEKMIRQAQSRRAGGEDDPLSLLVAHGANNGNRAADEKQIRDEVMTLLLAGHETTAATLTWTWYLLSQHPEVERRLQSEVDEVLGGGRPTLADVPRLVYTRMVVDEVLRLYPPVWLLPRKAVGDDRLGGYLIPAGSDVLVCVYTMHRHPDFWDKAEDFNPQRFADENSAHRVSGSYLPFGIGPRTCVGSRFGLMEVILAVAVIAQRYSLKLSAAHRVEPEPALTLHPRNGLVMSLHERR